MLINNIESNLQKSISLIAINLSTVNNLDAYCFQVSKSIDLRVTIIDRKGTILAETNFDKTSMDNHLLREEIQNSEDGKFSYVLRYSNTLKTDLLYVAKKHIYNGKDIYIRVSMSLSQIIDAIDSLYLKLFIFFLIVILFSFYITMVMSKRVISDINQITNYLDEISNKNYEAIIRVKYFYEFLQISVMLKNLVKKLQVRDRQKQKYIAKLRVMNKKRVKDKKKK